ncbi:MAG: PKD domain-containing protein, partial [Methanomicrobiales archaeon]|nr:PKD domain-containing protein [Methanomicrobiales archaeon]
GEDSAALSFGDQHENDLLVGNKFDRAHNQEEKTTPTSTPDPIPEETQELITTQMDPALYASFGSSAEGSEKEIEEEETPEETIPTGTPTSTPNPIPEETQELIITQTDPELYALFGSSAERSEKEIEEEETQETPTGTPTITLDPIPEETQELIITQMDPELYALFGSSAERSEKEIEEEETQEEATPTRTPTITPDPIPEETQELTTTQMDLELYASLTSSFFGTPQEGTAPLTVLFTDTSDGDVNTWMWDFGDSMSSRQKDPMHQYNDPGYYSVTLTISGPKGTDTITRVGYIFVSEPKLQERNDVSSLVFGNPYENTPILDEKLDNTHNQEKDVEEREKAIQSVTSTITPEPTPLLEETPITTQLDSLFYASPESSTEGSEEEPVSPSQLIPPHAVFTVEPFTGMVPLTVTFIDISTGSIKERVWSFGDKTESGEAIVEHTYKKAGKYPVSLMVTGYDGTMDRSSGFITVFSLPDPPVPKITCSTMEVSKITCEAMVSPEAGDVSWLWEFGDGRTSTEQNPVHTYETLGTYMVSVTAIDAYEQTGFGSIEVNLELPPLDATFTYEIDYQDPMTVTFIGDGEAKTWNWEFGDGKTGTGQNIKHSYNMAGEMNVTLTVADAVQEKQLSQKLLIYTPPIDVDFAITLIDAKKPFTVSFLDRSYGPIATWQWYFGDGRTSKEQNPVHTYNETGEYTVQLIITSQYGETKTEQVRFIIPEQGNGNASDDKQSNPTTPDIDLDDTKGNAVTVKQM